MNFQHFWKHDSELPNGAATQFGWRYLVTILLLVVLMIVIIKVYRMLGRKRRRRMMITLAVIMPLLEISRIVWELQIGQFSVQEDLPLQICRIMLFAQPVAVITHNDKLKTFCYAYGLPGAVLAYVLPTIVVYPILSFAYLRYIICHFALALVPLLWVFGDKFRPRIRVKVLLGVTLALALGMLGINSLLGSNYFYVNRLPGHVNINIYQPWYFIAMTSFMMVIVTLTMLPFLLKKSAART